MSQHFVNSNSSNCKQVSCFLCKKNCLPLVDFFNDSEAKDKKGILHAATSIISKKFNLTFPLKTSSEDTCDDCYKVLKELTKLQNVLEETEQRISKVFNLIDGKIRTTKFSFDDETTSLILPQTSTYDNDLIDIKSEPPSFSDQEDDYDCGPEEVPIQAERRTRKRKIHFDEIVPKASTSKRIREKGADVDVKYSGEIEISIRNEKKRKKWYSIRLETSKSSTRQSPTIENQLPRVVLQDFISLIPQDIYTKQLSPLDQCRFKLSGIIGKSEINPKQIEVKQETEIIAIIEPQSKTRKRRSKKPIKVENEPDMLGNERDSDYENEEADDNDNFTEGDNELNTDKDEAKPKRKRNRRKKSPKDPLKPKRIRRWHKKPTRDNNEVDPTILKSLTTFNGKKYFLNHEFEEDEAFLHCGFPSCDFKLRKKVTNAGANLKLVIPEEEEDDNLGDDSDIMMLHIKEIHTLEKPINNEYSMNNECPRCDDGIKMNLISYRSHMKLEHPTVFEEDPNYNQHPCPTCGKQFGRFLSLTLHNWTHYNTTERDALVAQGFKVPIPQRLTAKVKEFICETCNKVFSVKSNYTAHLYSHLDKSQKQIFLCDLCGREFTTKRGIDRHTQLQHDPDSLSGKWHVCDICPDKKYLIKSHLEVHKARHHGAEKKFMCEECGRCFPSKHCLKRHKISHNPMDWRPFKCEMCPEAYRYIKNLHRHIASSHGQEFVPLPNPQYVINKSTIPVAGCQQMYPCTICSDRIFQLPSRLTKHMNSAHFINDNDKPKRKPSGKPRKIIEKEYSSGTESEQEFEYEEVEDFNNMLGISQ